jgi:hypothetical protein
MHKPGPGSADLRSAPPAARCHVSGRLVFIGVKGGQFRRSNFSKPWGACLG